MNDTTNGPNGQSPNQNIPEEMRQDARWVGWTYEQRGEKQTKVPVDPQLGGRASTTDPRTWGTYEAATVRATKSGLAGVGFVLGDGWLGIDFDKFRDEDGYLDEPVPSAIRIFGTYAEVSPSRTGVKIIGRGQIPEGLKNRTGKDEAGREIEVYDSGRFFTVTGEKLEAAPATVREMPEEFETFCREFLPTKAPTAPTFLPPVGNSPLPDDEVIRLIEASRQADNFNRLMSGDTSPEGGDASRSDYALAGLLVYWTDGDAEQIERIMRRSSLQNGREQKWARRDYLPGTVNKVINEHISKGGDFYGGGSTNGATLTSLSSDKEVETASKGGKVSAQAETFETDRKLTDLGNGERLAERLRGKALYVYESKCWYVYTGKRWEEDKSGEVYRHASEAARAILHEAADEPNKEWREKIIKWSRTSESRLRREAMIKDAANIEGMTVSATIFDTDPYLLACNNGTLDLRTGKLRTSSPQDYISKLAPVDWHGPDEAAPRWHRFLEEILPDSEIRDFMQVATGYGATGLSNARAFFICHGSGRNGKGTFLETVRDVLGDYGHTSKAETFLVARREGGQASTDVADLKGSRLVVTSESRPGAKIDANLIKSLTGDDKINARHLFQRAIEFEPTWSVFLATNHRPEMPGDDIALWERVKLVPFDVRISDEQKDTGLKDKLMAEAPGILAWMVAGATSYIAHGLHDPEAIREATAEYQTESDPVGDFIARYLEVRPGSTRHQVTAKDLRHAWVGYCDENDITDIDARQVGLRLKSLHGKTLITAKNMRVKAAGIARTWTGFTLNDDGDDLKDHGEDIESMRSML